MLCAVAAVNRREGDPPCGACVFMLCAARSNPVCTHNALRVSRVLQGDGSGGYSLQASSNRELPTHMCALCIKFLRTAVSPSIGNGDDSMAAVPTGNCCRPTSGLALAVLIQLTNLFSQQGQHFRQKKLFQLLREGGVASSASALVTHGAWRYLPAPCVLWQRVCLLALGLIAARVGV